MQVERDFGQRAWIEAQLPPQERENGPGVVSFTHAAREYAIAAEMQRPQFANHAFVGVYVPQGNHALEE